MRLLFVQAVIVFQLVSFAIPLRTRFSSWAFRRVSICRAHEPAASGVT